MFLKWCIITGECNQLVLYNGQRFGCCCTNYATTTSKDVYFSFCSVKYQPAASFANFSLSLHFFFLLNSRAIALITLGLLKGCEAVHFPVQLLLQRDLRGVCQQQAAKVSCSSIKQIFHTLEKNIELCTSFSHWCNLSNKPPNISK